MDRLFATFVSAVRTVGDVRIAHRVLFGDQPTARKMSNYLLASRTVRILCSVDVLPTFRVDIIPHHISKVPTPSEYIIAALDASAELDKVTVKERVANIETTSSRVGNHVPSEMSTTLLPRPPYRQYDDHYSAPER